MTDYYDLPGHEIEESELKVKRLKDLVKAVRENDNFELLGVQIAYRYIFKSNKLKKIEFEAVLMNCSNHEKPRNPINDVEFKEKIAVLLREEDEEYPLIIILRKSFPEVLHVNGTIEGEPRQPCLYSKPWDDLKITLTSQRFLYDILTWMKKTSENSLHEEDQEVEQVFFDSDTKVILPASLAKEENESWVFIPGDNNHFCLIKVNKDTVKEKKEKNSSFSDFHPIVINCKSVTHGPILTLPNNLGRLHDLLLKTEINLWDILKKNIEYIYSENPDFDSRFFMIIQIPVKREDDKPPEKFFNYAFIMTKNISEIGLENNIIEKYKDKDGYGRLFFTTDEGNWKNEIIISASIIDDINSNDLKLFNNITNDKLPEKPLLIGCGSLGGLLLQQWVRMGWTKWNIVDDDIFYPHNLARHILYYGDVGLYKSRALERYLKLIVPEDSEINSLQVNIIKQKDILGNFISKSDFIVDVSTSVSVPKMLSDKSTKRCSSLFFTPSGKDSVLILEDDKRINKLDQIETQYYRWIISSEEGSDHLKGHQSKVRYGGGCRDVSFKISFSTINIHAGVLSSQLLKLINQNEAKLKVWRSDEETGSLKHIEIDLQKSYEIKKNEWKIIYDEGLILKARKIRSGYKDVETGGVIVGSINQVYKKIYVVDILEQPEDSINHPAFFERGVLGLKEKLLSISDRTAGLVNYIGEWHSHINNIPAIPSVIDKDQLNKTQEEMNLLGEPGLIFIIGETDYGFYMNN